MKLKTSVKMSDENLDFWRKLNLNLTLIKKTKQFNITPSDLQEYVVKYFKLKNDSYKEMAEFILEMEEKKNGAK